MGVRAFRALEWVTVKGRDMAVIEALPDGDDLYDPAQLKGQRILIDGTERLVVGVDTFAVPRGPDRPYRHSFGLLVE